MLNALLDTNLVYGTDPGHDNSHILLALEAGYRVFDLSPAPHTREEAVGRGLNQWLASEKNTVTNQDLRKQLFIQMKVGLYEHLQMEDIPYDGPPYNSDDTISSKLEKMLNSSLENLGLQYLDAWILHFIPPTTKELRETWSFMESMVLNTKKVRFLGISNVNADKLSEILRFCTVRPLIVQNRFSLSRAKDCSYDEAVRTTCREEGIVYQAFRVLKSNTHLLKHDVLVSAAAAYGVSTETMLFSLIVSSPRGGTQIDQVPQESSGNQITDQTKTQVVTSTKVFNRMKANLSGLQSILPLEEPLRRTFGELLLGFTQIVLENSNIGNIVN